MSPPSNVFIEISGVCNARCPYCVKGSGAQKQGGFMSVDTFNRVLGHLKVKQLLPKSGCAHLYNWGEPLLHPEINEILNIAGRYGLQAFISTNLIHLPELTRESLSVLRGVTISLSGFSQAFYGYIHGKQLTAVLRNIDRLQEMLTGAGCEWKPTVHWHRYRFNEIELESAKIYFKQRGIPLYPSVAYLTEIKLTQDYFFNNTLPKSERATIENDLFTDYLKKCYLDNSDIHYRCPEWDGLSIDENANLLLCCGWSNEVEGTVFGSIFDYDSKNIGRIKRSSLLCHDCLEQGIAKWLHNQGNFNLLLQGLISVRNVFNRLGLTHYIPQKGMEMLFSLATNLIIKRQITLLKK